ncbi:MAG: glycosyl transferase [Rhodobacter sp.]|nr:glycosyl transferase [Rhodobacter sp.]
MPGWALLGQASQSGAAMGRANVICIKWGTLFGPEYVNRLYSGVRRNLAVPVRFFCMTERADGLHPDVDVLPLPDEPFQAEMDAALRVANRQGAMRKVSLFRQGVIPADGPVLGFDLDVVITGALDDLLGFEPGKVAMRHDWVEKRKGRPTGHGSVFRFDPSRHGWLYDDLAAAPYEEVERARGSEQRYTSHKAMDRGEFSYLPDPWVVSFKHDCLPAWPTNFWTEPRLPEGARVVCFHGRPKMPEAVAGYRHWLRNARPCGWLRDHWIERARDDLGGGWA